MADMMTFPDKFEDFIKKNSWEDNTGAYNCELIKVEDVLNAWDHYTNNIKNINSNINNIYDCLTMIQNNLYDIEEEVDEI